jgi:hypothetical protein
MQRKLILPSLVLVFALLACTITINPTNPPAPVATTEAAPVLPPPAVITVTPSLTAPAPVLPPPVGPADVIRNATYLVPGCDGGLHSYTLTDGAYASGPDPMAIGYTYVSVGDMFGFGDLNYDGVSDAAVLLGVNCGGTGVFTYIMAMVSTGGSLSTAASVFIDDRPMITSLNIVNGEIVADITVHGAMDAMCCPSLPTRQGYRLYGSQLVRTLLATWDGGVERSIGIFSPSDLENVSYPFNVTGHVTIGPFENTLAYAIYAPDNTLVTSGSVMTDSPGPGSPGNFALPVNLAAAGVFGLVRIEFSELSAADGSVVTLDSVLVNVH